MKTLLWIDDVRNPFVGDWLLRYEPEYYYEADEGTHQVIWVKNYNEFVAWIKDNGLPTHIGFDHDLADIAWGSEHGEEEKTGMDCAKWLANYCMDNNLEIPAYFVQSANPVGKENIIKYLENAKKYA